MVENGTHAELESHSTGSGVAAAVPAAVQPALHGRQTRQVFNGLIEQLLSYVATFTAFFLLRL